MALKQRSLITFGAVGLVAVGVLAVATQTKSRWQCFAEDRNPLVEEEAFKQCIIGLTRNDMKENPHIYGVKPEDADRVSFEFLGKNVSPDDDPSWVQYRFRYPTAAGPYCRYYFPTARGNYHIQGAYPETDKPAGRC